MTPVNAACISDQGHNVANNNPLTPCLMRGTKIASIVAVGPSSVRLSNVIGRAIAENRMPIETVGEYLDAGEHASLLFMQSLRAFGRRTGNELEKLIRIFVDSTSKDNTFGVPALSSEVAPTTSIDEYLSHLEGLTYVDVLQGHPASQRLTNALADPEFGRLPLSQIFSDPITAREMLLLKPHFGRKSLVEFYQLAQDLTIRIFAQHYSEQSSLFSICAEVFQIPRDGHDQLSADIARTIGNIAPTDGGLIELMAWAWPVLNGREQDIINRRFGLDLNEIETLEEIGECYKLTRERVRQIEAKALRKLANRLAGSMFDMLLDNAAKEFWVAWPSTFITIEHIADAQRKLTPLTRLAINLADVRFVDWIALHGTSLGRGWLAPGVNAAAVESLAGRLGQWAANRALPLAIADSPFAAELALIEPAISLLNQLTCFDNYVFKDRPQIRLKRTVRLHRLMAANGISMSVDALYNLYRANYNRDGCSPRDLVIVMEDAAQLFLEIEEGLWFALGQGAGAREEDCPPCCDPLQLTPTDRNTVAGCLEIALRQRGPTSVGELYSDGHKILADGRAPSGIPWILAGRPELFVRVLPGVYALREQLTRECDLWGSAYPYLCNEAQARAYAFARKAGEPWGTYRFWHPAAELALCTWARFEAPEPLYHSLLDIARIEQWPIDDANRDEWLRIAAIKGRFEISIQGRPPASETRPELDRLLAACQIASERGAMNWLCINRIMGRRPDAAGGQALMSLMIALGCIDVPAGDPQDAILLPHPVRPRARELSVLLGHEITEPGFLGWEGDTGQNLINQVMQADPTIMGWVSHQELCDILRLNTALEAAASHHEEEDSDGEDLMERLMREHRRASEIARRNALAKELLEEDNEVER